jgi:hypothetical protein
LLTVKLRGDPLARSPGFDAADASRVERCYEPANAEFAVAIAGTDATGQIC